MTDFSKKVIEDNWKDIKRTIDILWNKLFRISYTSSGLDKDDFTEVCSIAICKNIDRWDPEKSGLTSFISMMLKNKACSYLTWANREKRTPNLKNVSFDTVHETDKAALLQQESFMDTDVGFLTLHRVVEDYCSRLTENQLKIFTGILDGKSVETIAKEMNRTKRYVRDVRKLISMDWYTKNIKHYMEVSAQ